MPGALRHLSQWSKSSSSSLGAVVVARRSGTVDYVDSKRIVVRVEGSESEGLSREMGADIYPTALMFWRFDRLWSRRRAGPRPAASARSRRRRCCCWR